MTALHSTPCSHHPRPKKVRIVYDASAKAKRLPQPQRTLFLSPCDLSRSLWPLLWFRIYRVALVAYIEKAFLQTGLQPMERDVTRDLWLKNPTQPLTKDNMQIYYIGKLVRSQKEHSDWFFERSEF